MKKIITSIGLIITVLFMSFGAIYPVAAAEMTSEADDLTFMREEEKLAHDVYVTLCTKWGVSVFQNIANSESSHMTAIKTLLDRYGIADPASGKGVGEFTNPDLQKLYDQLVAQGSKSLADALKVGATIEEIDIRDLQTRMAQTSSADIKLVYGQLLRGSENHLRAFTSTLQRQTGETYVPQYLDVNSYNAIIGASGSGQGQGQVSGYRWGRR